MAAVAGRSNLHLPVGAAAGAVVWTATEYASHRWVLHGPFGKGRLRHLRLGGPHQAHHRAPLATSLAARAVGHLAVAGTTAVASIGLGTIAPAAFARWASATFSVGYSVYEISHWNLHHRPARTQWGQQLRARHDRHHFGAPASNLGVTNNFWDRVFGTEAPNEGTTMMSAKASPAASPRAAV
jgi:sterol desaturase/sphingolipid hydroxylase (fatty acid hydroxylase superfamily)